MLKILTVLAFLSSVVFAQNFDYSKKIGIGGSGGYSTPVFGNDFNDGADGDLNWGAHIRYHLCQSCGIELAFTRHDFDKTNQALKVFDILFFERLKPLSKFTPVLGLGAGVADITNFNPSSLKLALKAKAGVEYALNQNFSLGLHLNYQHISKFFATNNLPNETIHVFAPQLGITWYFGNAKTVSNIATAIEEKITESDTDSDGVVDSKDKCPNTAPDTAVNNYGCAQEEKASVKLNIQFPSGKSKLSSTYDSELKNLATFMSENPKSKVEIQGHTDNTGLKATNKKLSQARADAVKNYLVNKLGVDASRLNSKGHGDEMPVADNSTAEGRQENRRVIAVISE